MLVVISVGGVPVGVMALVSTLSPLLTYAISIGLAFGKALLVLVPVVLVTAKLVPPLLGRVAKTGSQELYVLVVLALGFLTAAATQAGRSFAAWLRATAGFAASA